MDFETSLCVPSTTLSVGCLLMTFCAISVDAASIGFIFVGNTTLFDPFVVEEDEELDDEVLESLSLSSPFSTLFTSTAMIDAMLDEDEEPIAIDGG